MRTGEPYSMATEVRMRKILTTIHIHHYDAVKTLIVGKLIYENGNRHFLACPNIVFKISQFTS